MKDDDYESVIELVEKWKGFGIKELTEMSYSHLIGLKKQGMISSEEFKSVISEKLRK